MQLSLILRLFSWSFLSTTSNSALFSIQKHCLDIQKDSPLISNSLQELGQYSTQTDLKRLMME